MEGGVGFESSESFRTGLEEFPPAVCLFISYPMSFEPLLSSDEKVKSSLDFPRLLKGAQRVGKQTVRHGEKAAYDGATVQS